MEYKIKRYGLSELHLSPIQSMALVKNKELVKLESSIDEQRCEIARLRADKKEDLKQLSFLEKENVVLKKQAIILGEGYIDLIDRVIKENAIEEPKESTELKKEITDLISRIKGETK